MHFDGQHLLEDLLPIVDRAGDMVCEAAKKTKKIQYKGRIDLVTETDLAVETMLKEALGTLLPGSDFLAEETANATIPGECTWIIDPIDGTTNFAHGLPFVANSIGLWHKDQMILGVINLPLLGEVFTAVKGGGAFMNGQPIAVSSTSDLEHALLATGFPYDIETHLETVLSHLKAVLPVTQGLRRPGAAALDLAYIACGRYDGFFESALNPWDTAAGILLVEEAGGRISEFAADTPYSLGAPSILATNTLLHEKISSLLCQD
ncbi:inositol monophosphatase family protein [Pseudodesulfovibrio sp. JC047]|uniref:inositol monophosphatase family protein n=1 Tax=Pseudodesulfovibrio sp. JC047 TaxID=2683199 RepID=UPI0031BACCCA